MSYDTRRRAALSTLQSSLVALQRMAPRYGSTEAEAAALPRAALDAMLRARLAEVSARLVDAQFRVAEEEDEGGDEEGGEAARALLGHVVTLLAAERADIEAVLAEAGSEGASPGASA